MLLNITRRSGYTNTYQLSAGARITRWLAEQAAKTGSVTLYCVSGEVVVIPWEDIEEMRAVDDEYSPEKYRVDSVSTSRPKKSPPGKKGKK